MAGESRTGWVLGWLNIGDGWFFKIFKKIAGSKSFDLLKSNRDQSWDF